MKNYLKNNHNYISKQRLIWDFFILFFIFKKKPERSGRVTCTILTLTTHKPTLDPTPFLYLLPTISFSATPNASMQHKRKAQRQHRFCFVLHYTGSPKQPTKISSFFL
jgi:hypothetical protein